MRNFIAAVGLFSVALAVQIDSEQFYGYPRSSRKSSPTSRRYSYSRGPSSRSYRRSTSYHDRPERSARPIRPTRVARPSRYSRPTTVTPLHTRRSLSPVTRSRSSRPSQDLTKRSSYYVRPSVRGSSSRSTSAAATA